MFNPKARPSVQNSITPNEDWRPLSSLVDSVMSRLSQRVASTSAADSVLHAERTSELETNVECKSRHIAAHDYKHQLDLFDRD